MFVDLASRCSQGSPNASVGGLKRTWSTGSALDVCRVPFLLGTDRGFIGFIKVYFAASGTPKDSFVSSDTPKDSYTAGGFVAIDMQQRKWRDQDL